MEQRKDPRVVLEQTYDRKLDKLYTSSVKCPYCRKRIQKLQTNCSQCGLHKIQIARASNKRAKEMMKTGERGKIVKMRRRPSDVKLSSLCLMLIFGMFGAHHFYTGRKVWGWVFFGCMIGFIVLSIAFPLGDLNNDLEGMHPIWEASNEWGMPAPHAFLGVFCFVMWVYDIFGIVFGWYKYPVRLGEATAVNK